MAIKYLAGERLIGTAAERPVEAETCQQAGHYDYGVGANDVMGVNVVSGSNLIGKVITKVSFWIKYTGGALNGTLYCRAWDSSGNVPSTVAANFGSIAGSEITGSYVKHTFTISSGTYTILNGSQIGIEYDGSANELWFEGMNDGSAYGNWFQHDGSYSLTNATKAPSFCYTEPPDINTPNGTIFEESDTGKHYMFDGTSTWNEIA